jgi:glucokinase
MGADTVLAADIGGTQMRAALVDADGNVLVRRALPTPADTVAAAALIDLITDVGREIDGGDLAHAVVGLPGVVDYESGHLLWAPHLPAEWSEQLSRAALTDRLGVPVHVANDADLAAVGEAFFGAGVGAEDVAYLTVSTGIGAGVVHGRRLVRGRRSLAELGHTVVDWRSWHSGRPGTLEELGSGSGMMGLARDGGLGRLDAKSLQANAEAGDATASAIWEDAVAVSAAGVENLIMCFYPERVVIGGGLGRQQEFFNAVREIVLSRPEHHPSDLVIVPAQCGDDAGLAGAAAWAEATALA